MGSAADLFCLREQRYTKSGSPQATRCKIPISGYRIPFGEDLRRWIISEGGDNGGIASDGTSPGIAPRYSPRLFVGTPSLPVSPLSATRSSSVPHRPPSASCRPLVSSTSVSRHPSLFLVGPLSAPCRPPSTSHAGPHALAPGQIEMSRISKWIVPAGTVTSTQSPFLWPSSAFAIGVPIASFPSRRFASCSATIV